MRPIVDREQADQVLAAIPGIEVDMTQNWNRRYRENLERLKSGNLLEAVSYTHLDVYKRQVEKVTDFLEKQKKADEPPEGTDHFVV